MRGFFTPDAAKALFRCVYRDNDLFDLRVFMGKMLCANAPYERKPICSAQICSGFCANASITGILTEWCARHASELKIKKKDCRLMQQSLIFSEGYKDVPATGLEPVRYCYRGILSPLRLPIPPCRQEVGGGGFEPPKLSAADLQSVPFGHSGIHPY